MIVTDAWEPQVNGVVRTLSRTIEELKNAGHKIELVTPQDGYYTLPLPTYSEIKLAIGARADIEHRFELFEPEAVHIATEGTLGLAARRVCIENKFPFSTSYHTQYPEYISARIPIPLSWGYAYVRWFHEMSGRVMVTTPTMVEVLKKHGFQNLQIWSRGVDLTQFNPKLRENDSGPFKGMAGPIMLYVGRVSVEKNVETFLKADVIGTKVIVGEGPARDDLQKRFPNAVFLGAKFGAELAKCYANADVFVFPSLTDTFGLVILEAMACGTPVAAFDAPGPRDILPGSNAGIIGDNLKANIEEALKLDREIVAAYSQKFSWSSCAQEFLQNLAPIPIVERKKIWRRVKNALSLKRKRRIID
jgi:glycosyltransferase involved in cell wall biosynthesis